jgi:regulatory protein YycH of two-component signal transduction system YycFG
MVAAMIIAALVVMALLFMWKVFESTIEYCDITKTAYFTLYRR